MRPIFWAIITGGMLSGCMQTESATRSGPSGTEIQVSNGSNCYSGACVNYYPGRGTVSVPGRFEVPVPSGIGASDGWVSPGEFRAMIAAANRGTRKSATSQFD